VARNADASDQAWHDPVATAAARENSC